MDKARRFKIIFLKFPHEDSMTQIQEKSRTREFSDLKEAEAWAAEYLMELPQSGRELWRVYHVFELGL